jgi:hypothetical protein
MLQELLNYAISQFEAEDEGFPLPPKFLRKDDDQPRAWRHAIVDAKKIKSMAAMLRKTPGSKFTPKRVINNVPDEFIIAVFSRDFDSRENIYNWFVDNNIKFTGLHQLLPSMIERITRRELEELDSLDQVFIDIIEEVGLDMLRDNLPFLRRCASEEFYSAISEALRDTLDLALNLLLAYPDHQSFASLFLEYYPWLAENQPELPDNEGFDEGGDEAIVDGNDGEITQEQFLGFVRHQAKLLYDNASPNEHPWNLNQYTLHYTNVSTLCHRFSEQAKVLYENAFHKEHEGAIAGLIAMFPLTKNYKILDSVDGWLATEKRLSVPSRQISIDVSKPRHVHAVSVFAKKRAQSLSDNMDFLTDFHRQLRSLEKSISRLTEMTINQTGSLDEILDLTHSIATAKQSCVKDAVQFLVITNAYLDAHDEVFIELSDSVVNAICPDKPESVVVLEQDLEETRKHLASAQSSNKLMSDQLKQAYLALEGEKDRRLHQESQVDSLKTALHEARQELVIRSESFEITGGPVIDPQTLLGLLKGDIARTPLLILDTMAAASPDRLVVLDSAKKSAREADNFELPERLAQLIDSLINPYLDSIRSGKPDAEARSLLGQSYAAKESDSVMKSPRLRSMREFRYNGETMTFLQHVGIGRGYGTQRALRIYFKIIDDKVVIAYCGEHLENASTN